MNYKNVPGGGGEQNVNEDAGLLVDCILITLNYSVPTVCICETMHVFEDWTRPGTDCVVTQTDAWLSSHGTVALGCRYTGSCLR